MHYFCICILTNYLKKFILELTNTKLAFCICILKGVFILPLEIKKNAKLNDFSMECHSVVYSGEPIITTLEEKNRMENLLVEQQKKISALLQQKKVLKSDIENLKNDNAALAKNFQELQAKYQKFARNQKRLDKDFAIDCYKLLINYANVTVQQIHDHLEPRYKISYETTRLYCKALKEHRISVMYDDNNNPYDVVGNLV